MNDKWAVFKTGLGVTFVKVFVSHELLGQLFLDKICQGRMIQIGKIFFCGKIFGSAMLYKHKLSQRIQSLFKQNSPQFFL
jgi:hypothetical protein